ncbi:olfactory receptor 1468-like [Hyla sarda]|uniref:olfactory receptor 1468-like n=1 Tax=Hyla sarda TaxID=327740 RepID=UPI0024C25205|nr:olfactory receptor 1468-like [Hyla sarda]
MWDAIPGLSTAPERSTAARPNAPVLTDTLAGVSVLFHLQTAGKQAWSAALNTAPCSPAIGPSGTEYQLRPPAIGVPRETGDCSVPPPTTTTTIGAQEKYKAVIYNKEPRATRSSDTLVTIKSNKKSPEKLNLILHNNPITALNMQNNNSNTVTKILLLGFQDLHSFKIPFFLLLLLIFCVTICGNLLIIVVVSYSRSLHSPMYFFLTQLSFSDILLSTTIVPNMLHVVLYEGRSLPFIDCFIQFYFFTASETLECLLLTVMSYDRYQAICNPLHYSSVMDLTFCLKAVLLCWVMMLTVSLTLLVTIRQLQFCGPNIIDHFFCDFDPILELSCSDTFYMKLVDMILAAPFVICPFMAIMVSYIYIIVTILKIPSTTGRQKTFSTCSSHLSVVSLYYGSLICIYLFPNMGNVKKILSMFYTVVTPLLNPMIYSLSNREIKQAFKKLKSKISSSCQIT